MNARFWVYWNATFTKLTMRPGQYLAMTTGGPTDEGYERETGEYWFVEGAGAGDDQGVIRAEWTREARDCDGRYRYENTATCPVNRLRHITQDTACPFNDSPPPPAWEDWRLRYLPMPDWQQESASQRDFTAEAAGY